MTVKMFYRAGFKIRKKIDVEELFDMILNKEEVHRFIVHDRVRIELYRDNDGFWVADYGWIDDDWVSFRMEMCAYDVVWKYRKYINAQWFSED